jgi:hypothetical protein
MKPPPNTRMQRTRSSPSALRSPLMRCPLGGYGLSSLLRGWAPSLLVLTVMLLTSSCSRDRLGEVTSADVAGEYTFKEANLDSKHGPETLTLRPDGTYVQHYRPAMGAEVANEGSWRLESSREGRHVYLGGYRSWGVNIVSISTTGDPQNYDWRGNFGLLLEGDASTMRLLLNEDLNQRYEKRRPIGHR